MASCEECASSTLQESKQVFLFLIFFYQVSNIDTKSPLVGHLRVGDSIVTVAGLRLRSPEDWLEILYNRSVQEQAYSNQSSNADAVVEGPSKLPHHIAVHGFCACSEDFIKHENRLFGVMCPDDVMLFYQHPCTTVIPSGINSLQNIYCLKAADVVKCPACSMDKKSEDTSHRCSCLGVSYRFCLHQRVIFNGRCCNKFLFHLSSGVP